jgi:hypothetical protein
LFSALQGLDQAGGLHRGHQGLEAAGTDGGIDDVLLLGVEGHGLDVGLGLGLLGGGQRAIVGHGQGGHGEGQSGPEGETER